MAGKRWKDAVRERAKPVARWRVPLPASALLLAVLAVIHRNDECGVVLMG